MSASTVAIRSLVRRPAFTLTLVLTLTLGIGVTTAMFSIVDTVLIKPLPFPHGEQLVTVMEANPAARQKTSLIAPGRLEDWNAENRTFTALSGAYAENLTETSGGEPERLSGRRVAPRYFAVFEPTPLAGRLFTPDEERFGGPHAAIIGEGLWIRRYARAPNVVGRRLVFSGVGYTIVGVVPDLFTGSAIDVWVPAQIQPMVLRVREARFLTGVGRLKPGVTIAQGTADLLRVQQSLGQRFPASDKDWAVSVTDMKEVRVGSYRQALWLVFAAVGLLLAIAIANVAGLMLVQLHRRARELGIRQAVGGSRMQIVAAVMREVLLIAAVGLVFGTITSWWLERVFVATFSTVPRVNELALDWRALGFATLVIGTAALAFGLWPALHVTRRHLALAIAQAGTRGATVRYRLQTLLVVGQIALGILLVASAGLMVRTYYNVTHVDAGFSTEHAITFHVGAAWSEDRNRVGELQEHLIAELQRLPGVVDAGITNFLPATGATLRYQVTLEGIATADQNGKITVGERTASSGYLRALKVPLIAGAWCPPLHTDFKTPFKAMVNRAFADRYGPDLIGRHFAFDQIVGSHEIVGIVGDLIEDGPAAAAAPYVYACESAGSWPDPQYVVRTEGDSRAVMASVRAIVDRLDTGRAIFGVQTVDEALANAFDQPRLNARMLSLFAAAAMVLAGLGLYSLLMLLVTERTRELGVRMALGASPARVMRVVVAGAGRTVALGIGLGLALTFAVTRMLAAVLFAVSPLDPVTLILAVSAFGAVAAGAAAIPAARVARLDPLDAIRSE